MGGEEDGGGVGEWWEELCGGEGWLGAVVVGSLWW